MPYRNDLNINRNIGLNIKTLTVGGAALLSVLLPLIYALMFASTSYAMEFSLYGLFFVFLISYPLVFGALVAWPMKYKFPLGVILVHSILYFLLSCDIYTQLLRDVNEGGAGIALLIPFACSVYISPFFLFTAVVSEICLTLRKTKQKLT